MQTSMLLILVVIVFFAVFASCTATNVIKMNADDANLSNLGFDITRSPGTQMPYFTFNPTTSSADIILAPNIVWDGAPTNLVLVFCTLSPDKFSYIYFTKISFSGAPGPSCKGFLAINPFGYTANFTTPYVQDLQINRIELDLMTGTKDQAKAYCAQILSSRAPTRFPLSSPTFSYRGWYPFTMPFFDEAQWVTSFLTTSAEFVGCFGPQTSSSFTSLPLSMTSDCNTRFVSFDIQYQTNSWKTAVPNPVSGSVEFDLIDWIILNDPINSEMKPGSEMFKIDSWVIEQPSLENASIQSILFTNLPSTGSILTSQSGAPLKSSDISSPIQTSVQMFYKPLFSACSWAQQTCLKNLSNNLQVDSVSYVATNTLGRKSGIIVSNFSIPLAQYLVSSLDNSVPAQRDAKLVFPKFSTVQTPSALDDYVVIIESLPTLGDLSCQPLCENECEIQLLSSLDLPFVSAGPDACTFRASSYNIDQNAVYSSFTWYLSHKSLKMGSAASSTTNLFSRRVNQDLTITLQETEYWQQAAISSPLNITVYDPDWDLPFSESNYLVTILSTNPRLRIYPSVELNQSGKILNTTDTMVLFSADQLTINSYFNGTTLMGVDSGVCEVLISIQDIDSTTWQGYLPVINSKIIGNILTNHQDSTTKPSANSVIKSNAVLLSIVIGVPIILAIIIVIVCLRRKSRRKALEKRRLVLLKEKTIAIIALTIQEEGEKTGELCLEAVDENNVDGEKTGELCLDENNVKTKEEEKIVNEMPKDDKVQDGSPDKTKALKPNPKKTLKSKKTTSLNKL